MKRLFSLIASLAIVAGLVVGAAGPAQASVPDWDAHLVVKTAAEWEAIKTAPDMAYDHNLPASLETMQRKAAEDCPERPPAGGSENLCLWNGYSFSGTRWNIPISWLGDTNGVNEINGLSFYGSGINNASKSWYNQTYNAVRLFDRSDCFDGTWYRNLSGGGYAWQSSAADADWENRISSASQTVYSNKFCTSTPGQ